MKIKTEFNSIGNGFPTYIVAELSCNHVQKFEVAVKTIKAMKKAGADAVKTQAYTADTMTIDSDNRHFKIDKGSIWDGMTLYKLYQEAFTPWEWLPKLQTISHDLGMDFFVTAFDPSSVDFLEKMKVKIHKVASFEIRDTLLIKKIAKTKKPVIISTGIAGLDDVELAVKTARQHGTEKLMLLKCTSAYPTPLEEVNLNTMIDMKKRFKTLVGLSDHSMTNLVPNTAVALGADMVEKHFILDKKLGGHDATFSLDPAEFAQMVKEVRDTEKILGKVTYKMSDKVKKNREFGRSLFVVKDIKKGDKFTEKNIRSIRPGVGLHPKFFDKFMGKTATNSIKKGTPLSQKHLS